MTREDFELIAAILKSYRGDIPDESLDKLAYSFAASLTNTNAQFRAGQFINATKKVK